MYEFACVSNSTKWDHLIICDFMILFCLEYVWTVGSTTLTCSLFVSCRTADSKLNNFTRIEPTLHLLSITFDTNLARAIMTETHGVATRLMYQLYIALTNKKKSNLTGVAIETMRPAAPAKLNAVESVIYKDVSFIFL